MSTFESASSLRADARAGAAPDEAGYGLAPQPQAERAHIQRALDVLRRRWRAEIVWCLRGSPMRFNALLGTLDPISHKVLTEQLRALEYVGVVTRDVGTGAGRHLVYRLTPLGAELPPILASLRGWGATLARRTREDSALDVGPPVTPRHDVTGRSRLQPGEP